MKFVPNPNLVCTSPGSELMNTKTGISINLSSEAIQLVELFKDGSTIESVIARIEVSEDGTSSNTEIEEFIQSLIENEVLVLELTLNVELNIDCLILPKPSFSLEVPSYKFLCCPDGNYDNISRETYVFIGAPFDVATSGFPGARFAPNSIRKISSDNTEYHCDIFTGKTKGWHSSFHNGVKLKGKSFLDLGNVVYFIGESFDDYYNRLAHVVAEVVKRGGTPIVVGGDHSISYSVIKALATFRSNPLNIIHFDAHTDFANLYESVPHNHGNVFTRCYKEGYIKCINQFGIRCGSQKTLPSVNVFSWASLSKSNVEEVVDKLGLSGDFYLTVDVDVFDPSIAPGTGTPVPNGMTANFFFEFIELVSKNINLIGFDVVEVNPMLDVNLSTCSLASDIIFHILACNS